MCRGGLETCPLMHAPATPGGNWARESCAVPCAGLVPITVLIRLRNSEKTGLGEGTWSDVPYNMQEAPPSTQGWLCFAASLHPGPILRQTLPQIQVPGGLHDDAHIFLCGTLCPILCSYLVPIASARVVQKSCAGKSCAGFAGAPGSAQDSAQDLFFGELPYRI